MWGCCHADSPSVSQQHETSHRIVAHSSNWGNVLESYFLFQQMTNCTTKARGMPSLSETVVSWEIIHPKSFDTSYSFQGLFDLKVFFFFFLMTARDSDREEGVTGGRKRDIEGEGGIGVTLAPLSQKRGPARGKLRQPSLLLAGTMWSSLLPLSPFWRALFHTQTVAVALTHPAKCHIQTGSGEKRREGARTGGRARA